MELQTISDWDKFSLFFHAFGIISLLWFSPETGATITEGNAQSLFITRDNLVSMINRSISIISSPYWTLSFRLNISSDFEIGILMEYPEFYGLRNSYTSIIPGFRNFTTIGQLIGKKNPIQLMFISSCWLGFGIAVRPFRISFPYLRDGKTMRGVPPGKLGRFGSCQRYNLCKYITTLKKIRRLVFVMSLQRLYRKYLVTN